MSPIKMDRYEAALRVVIRYKDAFNRHDVEALLPLYREDCIIETSLPDTDEVAIQGAGRIQAYWQDFFIQHPKAVLVVEDSYNVDYRCVMQWMLRWQGTAGQERQLRGVDLFKVLDGVICEQLSYRKCGKSP